MGIWFRPTDVRIGYSRICVGYIAPKQYAPKTQTGPDATRTARRAPDLAAAATDRRIWGFPRTAEPARAGDISTAPDALGQFPERYPAPNHGPPRCGVVFSGCLAHTPSLMADQRIFRNKTKCPTAFALFLAIYHFPGFSFRILDLSPAERFVGCLVMLCSG